MLVTKCNVSVVVGRDSDKYVEIGDPLNPSSGLVMHCRPKEQCLLSDEDDGSMVFIMLADGIGEKDVLPVFEKDAFSFESVKWPGHFITQQIKNGEKIITLDKVNKRKKDESEKCYHLQLYFTFELSNGKHNIVMNRRTKMTIMMLFLFYISLLNSIST